MVLGKIRSVQNMAVVRTIASLFLGVRISLGSQDLSPGALLLENSALRKENADLHKALTDVRGDLRRRLQACCPCDNTTTTEAVMNPCWNVTSGDSVAGLECLTSPDCPNEYQDEATCEVDILGGWSGCLDVRVFELELFWDCLWVIDQSFSGSGTGVARAE